MIFPDEPLADDEIPQRRLKAELILDATRQMGIDASAVGDQDLKLGVEYLKNLAAQKQFPFLSANLVTSDGKPVFPAHVMKTLCGTKVGIFAVLTPTDSDGKATVPPPNYRVEDPIETAKKEIALLRSEGAQVIVCLSHLGLTDDHRLAREAPGIDFIFGGHSQSLLNDAAREPADAPPGTKVTWIFQAGFRAKELGRLDLDFKSPLPGALAKVVDASNSQRIKERILTYDDRITELTQRIATEPDADRKTMLQDQIDFYKEQKATEAKALPPDDPSATAMKNQLVDLNREIPDEPQVENLVQKALEAMSAMPATPMGPAPDANGELPGPATGPYVGVKVCQACHAAEYATWAQTDHAKAYKSLIADQRHLDFDCVSCHTTAYRQEGGSKDPFTIGGLANVQCEACHGAGRAHSADPKNVKLNVTFDEKLCRTCHSIEQTGDRFVLAEYLPKVSHVKPAPTPTPEKKKAKQK